ncbi:DUF6937 domain-containing protein [Clostridium sp. DL1XJH146]
MNKSKIIFGNEMSEKVFTKSEKQKKKYIKKFGDDREKVYKLSSVDNDTLGSFLNIKNIVIGEEGEEINKEKGLVIGNIRMGFGHYRISMAIASAAKSIGYTPYWFDLHSYDNTTGGKLIAHLNSLYSMGSRWSQKYPLFNKFYWEPLNSEGFKKLSYNSADQSAAELMSSVCKELPKDIPYIATHVWPSQAAVHAGLTNVVNAIPDNWPMALHLSEGAIHTVQTPSSYMGYRTLKGMNGNKVLNPIPKDEIYEVGHYIDHELVFNIEEDCAKRLNRLKNNKAKRVLITVGGAGAQKEIFVSLIKEMLPLIEKKELVLYLNVGDHKKVWDGLVEDIPELENKVSKHFGDWDETSTFAQKAIDGEVEGIHAFYDEDIFAAVYSTNILMRSADILITKPSELAFYPVPKLLIKRIGGHEAYGAVRASEVGDGTIECETVERTEQMLKLMLEDDTMLTMFNENIIRNKKIGIYDGAYKAVKLAVGKYEK